MRELTDPVELAGRPAPARVLFGPHETNLGDGRALSPRHTAYYARRAAGGAGVIVTETASVHADDHPYERAPLADACRPGWAAAAAACHAHGALVLAGLGHAGSQGSSAYSQRVLWAPSPVADVISREMPAALEREQIAEVVAGFGAAAALAAEAGLDGVEVDAGAYALLRQFHSGLTNTRTDAYGRDRLRLTREVLAAVRAALGPGRVLALRLSCDELAPWAGVTPEEAAAQVEALADAVDLLTVVRGGPLAPRAYRPDLHTPPGFNRELCAAMRAAAGGRCAVALQGSVVDADQARSALAEGVADLVEMTRAQIADPDLVAWARAGAAERIRPCVLCNQACQVRDPRNPVVSCIAEPRSGHETAEPPADPPAAGHAPAAREVLVVGGGPAGLECARAAALRGHRVTLAERTGRLGGMLRTAAAPFGGAAASGRGRLGLLVGWWERECRRLGVRVELERHIGAADLDAAAHRGAEVVLATGSRPGAPPALPGTCGPEGEGAPAWLDVADVLIRPGLLPAEGPLVLHDPIGGPVAVAAAEWLAAAGRSVHLVTPARIVGERLALCGDLADANARLQRAGVARHPRSRLRAARRGRVLLQDVWTAHRREIGCAAVIDCGHRRPEESLYTQRPGTPRAGDCVAPRTVLEAVLEGRRRAADLGSPGERGAPRPAAAAPAPG
ncbi:FAD-dependent oxidoreductase [Nocardiopsis rhodophaea]|uniref:FAD-dependent oxidoreductase n=1 Tax=Nocardiopsis rhodophaea TaxID=280238 RepID=A0ABP5F1I8_9ACTN